MNDFFYYINLRLLMIPVIVLTVLLTGVEPLYATSATGNTVEIQEIRENQEQQEIQKEEEVAPSGGFVPSNEKSTTVEEIREKINSMTSMPQTQPMNNNLSATYTPKNDTNVSDSTVSLDTSNSETPPPKRVKQHMSPIKLVLIIFLIDLLLLGGVFFYLHQKRGRKIK